MKEEERGCWLRESANRKAEVVRGRSVGGSNNCQEME